MIETPFFFPRGEASLFGVWHEPTAAPSGAPVVFCHPFGEEKLWAHRVHVSMARRLAAHGRAALRFDSMGIGDSSGRFQDSSLTTMLADVEAAVDEVRRRTGQRRVTLLGLRLGATVAALAAERLDDVERLVLWSPIVDGARYMQELLRINLSTQMAVYKEIRHDREALVAAMREGQPANIDGYEMTVAMYDEVSAVKLADIAGRAATPCAVVHIDRQPGKPVPEFDRLVASYPNGTLLFAQEEPFWKEIPRFYGAAPALFERTLSWLDGAPATVA